MKIKFKNIFFIIFGAAIFSFGVVHFNMQNNLGEGGFTGITLLTYFMFDWNPAIVTIILNIPLFIIGWKLLGRITFYYTIVGTLSVAIFLALFQLKTFTINLQGDLTLAALFSGVFIGVGLGITLRFGGTTGGVDIIARIAHKYFGWSMGRTMFIFDFFVIALSLTTYLKLVEGMYTLVLVYIGARVIDFIQEGAYSARGLTIISKQHEAIAASINSKMDRGVTILDGHGYYSREKQNVIYCIIGKNELMRAKNIVKEIDPYAFVAVTSVHEVLGEGFTLDDNKQPFNVD